MGGEREGIERVMDRESDGQIGGRERGRVGMGTHQRIINLGKQSVTKSQEIIPI